MTPRGHFTSLARRCRHAARYKDMGRLQSYLASPQFVAALTAQEGELVRRIAVRIMTEAVAECASGKRRPGPQPRVSTRWDEPRIARLRKALARGGYEAAAAELGVTFDAVRLAAKRHVPEYVAPATGYHRRAA